jgi:2-polyprenyl-3-methyl-5-hydroxy-6-metoxy-1,4-benzoquinol methylase
MNSCYLCGAQSFQQRPGSVRDDPKLRVMECRSCGLVFLSSFDQIGAGFYENSGMHEDGATVEAWVRETAADDERRFQEFRSLLVNRAVLDFGCGAGGFLTRASRVAAVAVGVEPESRLAEHFQKEQLTVLPSLAEVNQAFDLITLFHVLEHLPDPADTLKQLAAKVNPGGSIIVEVPNAADALLTFYENEAFSHFTYWSCHLFLFNANTLALLAGKAGLRAQYIKQVQRYPLSNHLYWLAKGRPGGHLRWNCLDSEELRAAYEKQLGVMGCCDTLIACFGAGDD